MDRLLEDGVYGEKTSNAVKDFASNMANIMPYLHELAKEFQNAEGVTNIYGTYVNGKYIRIRANIGELANKLLIIIEICEAYETIKNDVNDDIPGIQKETIKEVISSISGTIFGIGTTTVVTTVTAPIGPVGAVTVGSVAGTAMKEITETSVKNILDLIDVVASLIKIKF